MEIPDLTHQSESLDDDPDPLDLEKLRASLKVASDFVTNEMATLWNLLGWASVKRDTAAYENLRLNLVADYYLVRQVRDDFLSRMPDTEISEDDLSMLDIICDELHTCEMLKNRLKL